MRAAALACAVLALCACGGDSTPASAGGADAAPDARADASGEPAVCASARADFLAAVDGAERGTCAKASDCTLVSPALACEPSGMSIALCPVALSYSAKDSLDARIAAIRGSFCPSTFCGYSDVAECVPVDRACVDGLCRTTTP
ncbi:MAG: hypothetical protein JWP97_321 [Labilithrix sp.]|nr:hypothetical protein [Labilithrix sp.]